MVTPRWVRQPGPGVRVVHVNATATGGGVAELLSSLVPAQDAGWAVISGDDEFFAFTKYLHHALHDRADLFRLREDAHLTRYRSVLAPQADWLVERLDPGDVVVLHDPQTLGLAPKLALAGMTVVWHCHIGTSAPAAAGPATVWRMFGAELSAVDAVLTTLPEFAPGSVPLNRRHVVPPAIDLDSPKNRAMATAEVDALLAGIGLTAPGSGPLAVVEQVAPVPATARVVLQVSRWDPLKDMPGVLRCVPQLPADTHVVLAGNDPDEIPDDPEGAAVFTAVRRAVSGLRPEERARVHLVRTSSRDPERAALLVNALQRRADVVLQKSFAEGFGLTVTEAMAKGRAVVAADVGGLRQQVSPGHNGLLVDPRDRGAVVEALRTLLDDPELRQRLGDRAAASVARRYAMSRLVADYRQFIVPRPPLELAS